MLWHKHTSNGKLGHLLSKRMSLNWRRMKLESTRIMIISLVGFPVTVHLGFDGVDDGHTGMVLGSRTAWLPFGFHTAVSGSNGKMPSGCHLSDVVFCGLPLPSISGIHCLFKQPAQCFLLDSGQYILTDLVMMRLTRKQYWEGEKGLHIVILSNNHKMNSSDALLTS